MNRTFVLSLFLMFCLAPLSFSLGNETTTTVDATEFKEVTVTELVSDPSEFNNQRVTLEGYVDKVEYTKSSKGEPFTLFRMNDGSDNEVRVYYEDEHLPLSKGDKVRIQGRYKKQKKYLLYKIKNVIKARTVKKIENT